MLGNIYKYEKTFINVGKTFLNEFFETYGWNKTVPSFNFINGISLNDIKIIYHSDKNNTNV